jgi:hypothetical protein
MLNRNVRRWRVREVATCEAIKTTRVFTLREMVVIFEVDTIGCAFGLMRDQNISAFLPTSRPAPRLPLILGIGYSLVTTALVWCVYPQTIAVLVQEPGTEASATNTFGSLQ